MSEKPCGAYFFAFFENFFVPILTSGGYVGLSIATLLSQHHKVTAVDIIPEKVDMINNRKLRYLSIDYLLETEGVFKEFIQAAKKSGWMPHYYNSLYIAMKNVTNSGKLDKLFATIVKEVSENNPSEGLFINFPICLIRATKININGSG